MPVLLVYEILNGLSVEAAVYMLVERRQTDIVQRHVAQGTNHLGFLVVYTSRGSLKAIKCNIIITARKRSLGQGNIFTGVCPPGGGVCLWVQGCTPPGHTHSLDIPPPCPPRSTSGWYASYWNAFLFRKIHFIYYFLIRSHIVNFMPTYHSWLVSKSSCSFGWGFSQDINFFRSLICLTNLDIVRQMLLISTRLKEGHAYKNTYI